MPIETSLLATGERRLLLKVAFTPKGGCPLKPVAERHRVIPLGGGSIHPQGWVPIETSGYHGTQKRGAFSPVAFTPKGGCPLKLVPGELVFKELFEFVVAFTPKGGCPLKLFRTSGTSGCVPRR